MKTMWPEPAGLFTVALCVTVCSGGVQAQSGTAAPATIAVQELSPTQAAEFLAATLTSGCGEGTNHLTRLSSTLLKTSNVRVHDGTLSMERFSVSLVEEGLRLQEGAHHVYSVSLRDLWADADVSPQPTLGGSDGPVFECRKAGCVTIDGAAVSGLQITVCPEKRAEVLEAMQVLVLQAGGSRRPVR
jgi:hypothetical protein